MMIYEENLTQRMDQDSAEHHQIRGEEEYSENSICLKYIDRFEGHEIVEKSALLVHGP